MPGVQLVNRGTLSAFSVENPHDGKTFENYSRFEWGVEVGVVTTFMLRLFVPHEFDMVKLNWMLPVQPSIALESYLEKCQSTVCRDHCN